MCMLEKQQNPYRSKKVDYYILPLITVKIPIHVLSNGAWYFFIYRSATKRAGMFTVYARNAV